jgi:uncharacterized protein (DUF4415 family)
MARPPERPRRTGDVMKDAEAVFRKVAPKLPEAPPPAAGKLPVVKETVTLRIDSDVLAVFQEDGPGWQDRINTALRKVAGL